MLRGYLKVGRSARPRGRVWRGSRPGRAPALREEGLRAPVALLAQLRALPDPGACAPPSVLSTSRRGALAAPPRPCCFDGFAVNYAGAHRTRGPSSSCRPRCSRPPRWARARAGCSPWFFAVGRLFCAGFRPSCAGRCAASPHKLRRDPAWPATPATMLPLRGALALGLGARRRKHCSAGSQLGVLAGARWPCVVRSALQDPAARWILLVPDAHRLTARIRLDSD